MEQIGVVGGGTMGSQIAAQSALHGLEVQLIDTDEARLQSAMEENERRLRRRVEKRTLSTEQLDATLDRITVDTDVSAVSQASLVIEAIVENLDAKRQIFTRLAELCSPDAILATNSSSFPISRIFGDLPYPDRTCNLHFFHPVLVMKLVEIMRGAETSDETIQAAVDFARRIEREPVVIEREVTGLIVNRILAAIKREALWLAYEGYATPLDIDRAVKLGLNHPMGPFELTDFSGLDVFRDIMLQRYEETGDDGWRPPPVLEEKVAAGELGRKSGRGFYEY